MRDLILAAYFIYTAVTEKLNPKGKGGWKNKVETFYHLNSEY